MGDEVLVAVDLSAAAFDAVGWAAARYRHERRSLVLAHVVDDDDADLGSRLMPPITATAAAGALVDAHRARAARLAPRLVTRSQLLTGPVVDALVARTQDAGVLVFGSLGRAAFTASALGSVGHQVATHAHCPVILVPAGAVWRADRPIVVATSAPGVPGSADAFAAREADLTGSPVVAVDRDGRSEMDWAQRLSAASGYAGLIVLDCHHGTDHNPTRLGAVAAALLPRTSCAVALLPRAAADRLMSVPPR